MSKFARVNKPTPKPLSFPVQVAQIRQPAVVTTQVKSMRKASETANKTNMAGGKSFQMSDKMEFVTTCAAKLLHTGREGLRMYETEEARTQRLKALIPKVGAEFAAKTALWLRISCGSRSMSHLLGALIAPHCSGELWATDFYSQVVVRPDDMCEIAAAIWKYNGQKRAVQDTKGLTKMKLPNAVKRGFANAFGKFDQYRLAKYANKSVSPNLRSLILLTRPKPNERNEKALAGILAKNLINTDTWEAQMSAAGQSGKSKGDTWTELVQQGKLGQLALLKNLRNIAEHCTNATIMLACAQLTNAEAIRKNGILPAQYIMAYNSIKGCPCEQYIRGCIDAAVEIAAGNVPQIGQKVLIAIDESGSMQDNERESAALFAATLLKSNPNSEVMFFASGARYVTFDRKQSLLQLMASIRQAFGNGGTDFNQIFKTANKAYDTIVILSDNEGWMGSSVGRRGGAPVETMKAYQTKYNIVPTVFSFDLGGDGSLMFREDSIITLAGCSFQVFKLLNILKNDRRMLVDLIDSIEIGKRLPTFEDED